MLQTNHPMVEALRLEVKTNQVFKDVCHMFSLRQRTRGRLTVTRLKQAMEAEGFNYSRKQYEEVLKFMGNIGIGQLEYAKRGKVKSLNNVKLKLQSIGAAALAQGETLLKRTEVNRYDTLMPIPNEIHKKDFIETKPIAKSKPKNKPAPAQVEEPYPVFLTMILDGKLVNIPGPKNVSSENLGEFIMQFKKLAKKDVEV